MSSPSEIEQQIHAHLDAGRHAEAVGCAVRAYGPALGGYLFRLTGNAGDADDALGAAMMDVWRAVPKFRRQGSFRAWMYTIGHRAALRLLCHPARRRTVRLGTSSQERLEQPHPGDFHWPEEDREASERALSALPVMQRAAVALVHGMSFSYEEAAEILAGPDGERPLQVTLRSQVCRGVKTVREAVESARLR
jgi:RNA polymerase sigma-70 factor, ECF subfamily